MNPVRTTFLGLVILLFSCRDSSTNVTSKRSVEPAEQQEEEQKITEASLIAIDTYFDSIYSESKLIWARDDIMLAIIDSLFSSNQSKEQYYFIVFSKSLVGADGFYSEGAGNAALTFIQDRTQRFAEFFTNSKELDETDLTNWAEIVWEEIQISYEDGEQNALANLEQELIHNVNGAEQDLKVLIREFLDLLKSTAYNKG